MKLSDASDSSPSRKTKALPHPFADCLPLRCSFGPADQLSSSYLVLIIKIIIIIIMGRKQEYRYGLIAKGKTFDVRPVWEKVY